MVRGPAVFSCHLPVVLHGVFVIFHQQRLGTDQTCLLADCHPLIFFVFCFSLPLRTNEVYFLHGLVVVCSVALAAVQACVVVMDHDTG